MSTTTWAIIIVAAIIIIGIVAWLIAQRRRTEGLREHYGPEYDTTVKKYGDERKAQTELEQREKRVEALEIRPLSPELRTRYLENWKSVQAHFVDNPPQAVNEADRLVSDVMRDRGYPVADYEQRAEDISVNHPEVVNNYRAAHATAEANSQGQASTEDLRQAMVYYRALFEELLGNDTPNQRRDQNERVA